MRKFKTDPFHPARSGCIAAGIVVFLLSQGTPLRPSPNPAVPEDPNQLVREVIYNEINASTHDGSFWCYRERQQEDDRPEEIRDVVDTREGEIQRLIAINGALLTSKQQQAEERRIERLIQDPEQLSEQAEKRHEDDEKMIEMMKMLPNAFRYNYDGTDGDLVRLKFVPDPNFKPPDREAQVFHHMEGIMLVDPREKRLAGMEGKLTSEVKFGFGLFGHLDEGGTFVVRQAEVAPDEWQLVQLDVQMDGKALFFKTIVVRQKESYSDFRIIPRTTTLPEALVILKSGDHLRESASASSDPKDK